jgi:hypothetical protein
MTGNQAEKFDPFNDRRARLVRNYLSSAFIEAVRQNQFSFFEQRAQQLVSENDLPLYRRYIEKRMKRFRQAFDACAEKAEKMCDVFYLAVLLWKYRLFFEVHEVLEQEWRKEAGKRRKALQGLIQAAGYYLLLEAGNFAGAFKLADKAVANLVANREQLPYSLHIEELIDRLRKKDGNPPRLA